MNQPWVDDLEEASDYESEEDWSDDRKRSERVFYKYKIFLNHFQNVI